MKLFVANCTMQNQIVYYRLDFDENGQRQMSSPPKSMPIPSGKQVALGGDLLHRSQADAIMGQLRNYGMADVTDIDRLRGFVPYLANCDKPLTAAQINKVTQHNAGIRIDEGRDRRKKAAVVVNNIVDEVVASQMAGRNMPIPTPVGDGMELAFEQQEVSEAGESSIQEGYRVSETGHGPAPTPGRRGPRAKRAA